jgi:hypothetical protein
MSQSVEPKDTILGSIDLYFGYRSNTCLEQTAERCPDSTFVGIAPLRNYRWMINDRGSAKPVPFKPSAGLVDEGAHV